MRQQNKSLRSARHFIEEYRSYKGHPRVSDFKRRARRAVRRAFKGFES